MEAAGWTALGGVIVAVIGAVVAGILKVGGFFRTGSREVRRDTIAELYAVIDLQNKRLVTLEGRADATDENHLECEKRAARQVERIANLEEEVTRLRGSVRRSVPPTTGGVEGADV